MKFISLISMTLIVLLIYPETPYSQPNIWDTLENGLELGRFKVQKQTLVGDSTIAILRVDPDLWVLKLFAASLTGDAAFTAKECSEKHNLTAAINAGMFDLDFKTHTGYLKVGNYLNNSKFNQYNSVVAFDQVKTGRPPFRIFDLDEVSSDEIIKDYRCVVQNLRLIKRPGENRWSKQPKRWSEAALGEDNNGRALFIFCRSPYTMNDLNEILLSLPINLICAQHLEGGPEAQLYIKSGDTEVDLVGSYETGFNEKDDNVTAWPIPNIIGIKRKP